MAITLEEIVQLLKQDQTTSMTLLEELAAIIQGGGQYKKLATINFTDFQPEAGFTKVINLGASPLIPPRGIIRALYFDYQTAFAGAGVTSALMAIKDSSTNIYLNNVNVFTAIGNTVGANYSGGSQVAAVPSKAAATNLTATLTLNAAALINDLTSGKVTLYGIIAAAPNS